MFVFRSLSFFLQIISLYNILENLFTNLRGRYQKEGLCECSKLLTSDRQYAWTNITPPFGTSDKKVKFRKKKLLTCLFGIEEWVGSECFLDSTPIRIRPCFVRKIGVYTFEDFTKLGYIAPFICDTSIGDILPFSKSFSSFNIKIPSPGHRI